MLKSDERGFNAAQPPSTVSSSNYMAKSCKKMLSLFVSCYAFSKLQLHSGVLIWNLTQTSSDTRTDRLNCQ